MGHREGKQSRVAGEQAPGSILLSEKDLAKPEAFRRFFVLFFFFPLEKICFAYRFSLIRVSKSVFPHTRDIQRVEGKPCKLPQGQLASLENRIKGFIFPSERLWMK